MASLSTLKNSALWAAWGDSLGFITELVDVDGVRRRVGSEQVSRPVPWARRVGGRLGSQASLPAGAYSDDTQLRLATSRAIRGDGSFAAEAFAKVELPLWLAYGLGGGRGSRAAAASLMKQSTNWTSNFFTGKSQYIQGGGNGAAMRVQPHVWAAQDPRAWDALALDVVRNAICTHGHPRGILGAVLHAITLAQAVDGREPSDSNGLVDAVNWLAKVHEVVASDEELSLLWVPAWERGTGQTLQDGFMTVVKECEEDLATLLDVNSQPTSIRSLISSVDGLAESTRGSGTKTALLAAVIASTRRDDAEGTLVEIANTLGADTDTLGTMTGALLGTSAGAPPTPVQDEPFISNEAVRLKNISEGRAAATFGYPDLLSWRLPKASLDFVGMVDEDMTLAGLGRLAPVSEPVSGGRSGEVWQWVSLPFHQQLFIRRRETPGHLPRALAPRDSGSRVSTTARTKESSRGISDSPSLFEDGTPSASQTKGRQPRSQVNRRSKAGSRLNPEGMAQEVVRSGYDATLIGEHLTELAGSGDEGFERAIAFSALVAHALRAAQLRGGTRDSS